jgi:methionyl-tRNA synthetase
VEAALPEKIPTQWTRGRVRSFFLTTAIDYANGDPHLGHAFEKVGADCIARYRRLRGDDVWFLMGMDEHGQKVAQAAAADGVTPQALVDRVAGRFESTWDGCPCPRPVHPHDLAGAPGWRGADPGDLRAQSDDFYERAFPDSTASAAKHSSSRRRS